MLCFNLILGLDYIFLYIRGWGGGGGGGIVHAMYHNEFETKENNIILIQE